jgi:hypothetical protein
MENLTPEQIAEFKAKMSEYISKEESKIKSAGFFANEITSAKRNENCSVRICIEDNNLRIKAKDCISNALSKDRPRHQKEFFIKQLSELGKDIDFNSCQVTLSISYMRFGTNRGSGYNIKNAEEFANLMLGCSFSNSLSFVEIEKW